MDSMLLSQSQEGAMTDTSATSPPHRADASGSSATTQAVPGLRSATRQERERFEVAMMMAFISDPAARWAWSDQLQFLTVFLPLVNLFGGKSFDHDCAHVIGDFHGVAQWLPPGVHPDDEAIGELFARHMSEPRLGEVLSLFEQMAAFHPSEPHWYLPLIGVDPLFRGRGYGTLLMQQGLAVCDRSHQCVYLEATSPLNRTLYERFGFRTLGEIRSGDSPPLFPMLREPH